MADKNTTFHEGTTEPVGEVSSYGWTPGGSAPSPADSGATSSYGWQGDSNESGDTETFS